MENLNSVCFINKINKIEQIIGSDNIELAFVNGWSSVVQKNTHKEGDFVLCMTTDAVIPEELSTKWNVIQYLRKGTRVRTVKLRGVYSECILIPLHDVVPHGKNWHEGSDLMDELKIYKYDPPVKQVQLASGKKIRYRENPAFEIYYKFPNQKNVPNMFSEESNVVITRKLHGTNSRYSIVKKVRLSILDRLKSWFGNKWISYEFAYGSHNVQKGSDSQGFYNTDVWDTVGKKHSVKEKLWAFVKLNYTPKTLGSGIVVYGEIFGEGIQKNYDYGHKELQLQLFDVMLNGKYLSHSDFLKITMELKICENVQTLHLGKWSKEIQDSFVLNNFIAGTKIPHEGVVVKDIDGDRKKVSKVVNPEYLTYGEKHGTTDSH